MNVSPFRRRLSYDSSHKDDSPSPLVYPPSSSAHHSDLPSFLAYAKRTGLAEESTVYVGTHYEYTVAASLRRYGFDLRRIGGRSDFGTDLLGTWTPPTATRPMRVLVQCKAVAGRRGGTQFLREMEGAFAGAPVGWRGAGVLGVLASELTATKAVREALARSRWPMSFVSCGRDGALRQMLWNQRAVEEGLEGYGVVARHGVDGGEGGLVLVRDGKVLPFVEDEP